MADDEGKEEVAKDVLAPAEGPREEIITTAVKFLQNPKVRQSPLSQKKAFLLRKGLTKEEIDVAVQRTGIGHDDKVTQVFPPQSPGQMVPYPYSNAQQVAAHPVLPYTKWQKVRDVLSVIALATGMTYAAYRFYKEVLRPWLLGQPRVEDRLVALERLQGNVLERVTSVQEALTSFQDRVVKEQDNVQQMSHEIHAKRSTDILQNSQDSQTLHEVKSELTSIKGLLLNRRQFPPTPVSTPLLPSWQLSPSGDGSVSSTPSTVTSSLVVTPGGDSGNLTDSLAMLNSNDSSREDNSDTEVKAHEVSFSQTSASESTNSPTEVITNDNVSENGEVVTQEGQRSEVNTRNAKTEQEDELD